MDRDLEDNTSNSSSYCFNFTARELKINTAVTVSLHVVAILACLLTILFILTTRQYRAFVNRLVLYLMLVASVWSVFIIVEVIPVEHDAARMIVKVRDGWEGACAAAGFLSQLVETAKILVVCWIVFYLLMLVVFKRNTSKPWHEALGVVIVVGLPLLIDWLPFRWHYYGLSGLWCWIEISHNMCSDDFLLSLGLMLAIEYIPVLLVIIFTIVSFVCITVALCRRAHRVEIKWKWTSIYKRGLAEATALMVYPTIYALIFVFRVIHRTYYLVQIGGHRPPYYTLWLAHSAALGIGGILVPLLYLLRPSNLRKFYVCRKFFLKKKRGSMVVYRSNSVISTENLTDGGEIFTDPESTGNRDSSLIYRSIMS